LFCAGDLDFTLLPQHRELLIFLDGELLARGIQVFGAHLHLGVLLHVVALLAARFSLLGQAGQTFRVKSVVRVEELFVGLVQAGQRHGLQLQAILLQVFGHGVLHGLHKVSALVLQLLDGHGSGGCAQRIDELVFHQLLEFIGAHRAGAQRLCGNADRLGRLLHAHEESGRHVHPHPVFGDQAFALAALHFELERVHVDQHALMEDGQHDGATIHDHLLAPQARAHKGRFFGGSLVQPGKDDADGQQAQQGNACNQQEVEHVAHG